MRIFEDIREAIADHPLKRFMTFDAEHRSDPVSPVCILLLGLIGVFFIYSAQSYNHGSAWKMQIIWLVLGGLIYTAVSLVNYKFYLEVVHFLYWGSIVLLIPLAVQALLYELAQRVPSMAGKVDLPFIITRFGSTRWLDLQFFALQPSEIAKIGTLLMVSALLIHAKFSNINETIKVLLKVAVAVFIPLFLIFLQPDLGSSLVFPPMVLSLLYVSNLSRKFFAATFGLLLLALLVTSYDIYRYQDFMRSNELSFNRDKGAYEDSSWVPLRDYQRNRILTFVAPSVIDPRGIGDAWNLNQSLIAVAGGGLTGKGLGEGTQAKLGYLPQTVASNDFIFAVVAEEAGFVGGTLVLALYCILIINGIRIATLARDRFGVLLAVGVSTLFLVHIFVNVGMVNGMMPITGLPLPFLSYGGSFVISCCILQGLIQSVYRFRKDFT